MSSPVDLANRALVRVGGSPVISFEDNTTEADLCARLYEPTKRSVLRSFPWNCATFREKLAQRAEPPVNEWPYAFALPEHNLRVLDVYVGDRKATRKKTYDDPPYQLEGQSILAWETNVFLKYIKDIDEAEMDQHVQDAVVAQLAFELSYPLTGSNNTFDRFQVIAENTMNEARTTDAQEQPKQKFRVDRLRIVRR